VIICCFFFQAEDGIRDRDVTGVQTCALPICLRLTGLGRACNGSRKCKAWPSSLPYPRLLPADLHTQLVLAPGEAGCLVVQVTSSACLAAVAPNSYWCSQPFAGPLSTKNLLVLPTVPHHRPSSTLCGACLWSAGLSTFRLCGRRRAPRCCCQSFGSSFRGEGEQKPVCEERR